MFKGLSEAKRCTEVCDTDRKKITAAAVSQSRNLAFTNESIKFILPANASLCRVTMHCKVGWTFFFFAGRLRCVDRDVTNRSTRLTLWLTSGAEDSSQNLKNRRGFKSLTEKFDVATDIKIEKDMR